MRATQGRQRQPATQRRARSGCPPTRVGPHWACSVGASAGRGRGRNALASPQAQLSSQVLLATLPRGQRKRSVGNVASTARSCRTEAGSPAGQSRGGRWLRLHLGCLHLTPSPTDRLSPLSLAFLSYKPPPLCLYLLLITPETLGSLIRFHLIGLNFQRTAWFPHYSQLPHGPCAEQDQLARGRSRLLRPWPGEELCWQRGSLHCPWTHSAGQRTAAGRQPLGPGLGRPPNATTRGPTTPGHQQGSSAQRGDAFWTQCVARAER